MDSVLGGQGVGQRWQQEVYNLVNKKPLTGRIAEQERKRGGTKMGAFGGEGRGVCGRTGSHWGGRQKGGMGDRAESVPGFDRAPGGLGWKKGEKFEGVIKSGPVKITFRRFKAKNS